MANYSYLGSGKIYAKVYGAASAYIEMGNCSALSLAITEDVKELRDFTTTGGGTYTETRRIQAVEVSITAHDLDAENLKKALFGDSTTTAAGLVTDEAIVGYKGGFIPLARPVNKTGTPTITSTGASPTTFSAGTDYELRDGGIYIPTTSTISNGQNLLVDYTALGFDAVQAITQSAKDYAMFFEGLNEARSGKPTTVELFKVKIGAAQNLSLIGEDFAALEMTGKVLQDTTKTGSGISKYAVFKVAAE